MAAAEFEIRPAEVGERDALGALWFRSARDAHDYLPALQALTEDEAIVIFRRFAEGLELWVAAQGSELVGLLALEDDCVDRLYIAPRVQGMGVGSRLLDRAKRLRPRGLRLYTHQKNARARAFYEARGFRPIRFGVSPAPESEPDVEYAWSGG